MLDLGCGAGRHSTYLASRGFRVTGLDLSGRKPRQARKRERFEPPASSGRTCGGRSGSSAFDYVLSLFTSFGYFDDPAEHLTVSHNIAKSLKAGGTASFSTT